MAYENILYAVDDRVATITMNRPTKMNAMSLDLCAEVKNAVAKADADPEVRVLILTGAGGRAFSAGYDLADPKAAHYRDNVATWNARMNHDLDYNYSVWRCSKPVIAMISGYCLAGALELAQMCDIRYCSDDSKFGVVETRFSAAIACLSMPWILGPRCRELIYTGDTFGAEEAYRLGLVSRVFPKKDLERETMKIAKRMSRVAIACLQWNKRALNQTQVAQGLAAALQYGAEAGSILDGTETPELKEFNRLRSTEGLAAAMKWRDDQFKQFE
ncbi:MAG: enoyl-CoA hydratase/isomerase family protein [Alphaproteobacteria bacterium]